ncbi:MAG: AcrB/AcrD/AcrF family protein [Chlamydiae bacterium]|nr:MAG: AcrB/AcrD/AcrF family protein [Chlamydiota bacterium]
MKIAEITIKNKVITTVLIILAVFGGIISYQQMGRLEDPEFTIKDILITTIYPGATAKEVEKEVTDVIEQAAQQLGQTKEVVSESHVGFSTVTVTIKDKYDKYSMPQVKDELRRKIADAQEKLPPGCGVPMINDDYGDVYGVYVAFTGDNYSIAELYDYLKFLKRELLLVQDVKKVEIFGNIPEVVYVEMLREKMSQLGITQPQIYNALSSKNLVSDAGKVVAGTDYIPIQPSGEFTSVDQFGDLLINNDPKKLVYLRDVAKITRGYKEPPNYIQRFNGKPALALGVSCVEGGNVVTMGNALAVRFKELKSQAPAGIKSGIMAMQSESVTKAVNSFVINLIEAILIVIIVLLIFMGLRSGLIIGAVLLITICATFIVMKSQGIILQRISLGALIISLGMLVDNAIVVTEGLMVKIQAGEDKIKSANEVVSQTMYPLLGGTLVAITAFGVIGLSDDSTGEFCRSLFEVVGISLLLSWITAITITPFLCTTFFHAKPKKEGEKSEDPYAGGFFKAYKKFLNMCLRFRWITVAVMVGLLIISIVGFKYVDRTFFPPSTMPQFMVNFWLPEGTDIRETEKKATEIEKYIMGLDHVTDIGTIVGQGAARFLLTFTAEKNNSCYAYFLVSVDDSKELSNLMPKVQKYLDENQLDGIAVVQPFEMGPGGGAKIEARFSGPNGEILREIANQAIDIMYADGGARGIRTDWRHMIPVIQPVLSEVQARRVGIERPDVCKTLQMSFDGTKAGIYRERDELLDIIARAPENERNDISDMNNIQIWSPAAEKMIPLRQVISGFETIFEDSIRFRRDRRPTITAQCDQRAGPATLLLSRIKPKIEAIKLPPGYNLEWGGEFENSNDAQAGIAANAPLFLITMVLIVIFLFNSIRQPLVIWLTVPFAMIGITAGLLITKQPFGFMALLGMLSLVGMQIKNAIVLIDEINSQLKLGKQPLTAILDSAVSRIRPVSMAAATTVLGMMPLLLDAFFKSMAVTIMFGLTFACVLTMIIVPVFYAIFFKIKWVKEEG